MSSTAFDLENPKYRCFFVHVTTATKWTCYFNFVLTILLVGFSFIFSFGIYWNRVFALFFAYILALSSNYYAIKKGRPEWLIPYIALLVSLIFLWIYMIGFLLIYKSYELGWLLFYIARIAANIWFITIVFRCYHFLNENEQRSVLSMSFENENSETMIFAIQATKKKWNKAKTFIEVNAL